MPEKSPRVQSIEYRLILRLKWPCHLCPHPHRHKTVLRDDRLAEWDGFGVVVQAYSKRASAIIAWLYDCLLYTSDAADE